MSKLLSLAIGLTFCDCILNRVLFSGHILLLLPAVVLYCLSPYCMVPGNALVTAMQLCLHGIAGGQCGCCSCPAVLDRLELQSELELKGL